MIHRLLFVTKAQTSVRQDPRGRRDRGTGPLGSLVPAGLRLSQFPAAKAKAGAPVREISSFRLCGTSH
jgi:hypothetical protein